MSSSRALSYPDAAAAAVTPTGDDPEAALLASTTPSKPVRAIQLHSVPRLYRLVSSRRSKHSTAVMLGFVVVAFLATTVTTAVLFLSGSDGTTHIRTMCHATDIQYTDTLVGNGGGGGAVVDGVGNRYNSLHGIQHGLAVVRDQDVPMQAWQSEQAARAELWPHNSSAAFFGDKTVRRQFRTPVEAAQHVQWLQLNTAPCFDFINPYVGPATLQLDAETANMRMATMQVVIVLLLVTLLMTFVVLFVGDLCRSAAAFWSVFALEQIHRAQHDVPLMDEHKVKCPFLKHASHMRASYIDGERSPSLGHYVACQQYNDDERNGDNE